MEGIGATLWSPPADVRETSQLGRFLDFVRDTRGREIDGACGQLAATES